jgi:hypothetical protein
MTAPARPPLALTAGWIRRPAWLLLVALLLLAAPAARAEPNAFEQRKIEAQALDAYRRMTNLWREEVYFELYDFGMEASKARIAREAFAQRMVQLEWLPAGELNPKYLKVDYRFRTLVYVHVRIRYRHKFDPTKEFEKDQTVLMMLENGNWRVDLIDLIRSPYVT